MTTSAYVLIIGLLVVIIAISIWSTTPSNESQDDDQATALAVNTDNGSKSTKPTTTTTTTTTSTTGTTTTGTTGTTGTTTTGTTGTTDDTRSTAPTTVFPLTHTVKRGDNYTTLARQYYGCKDTRSEFLCAKHIQQANPGIAQDALRIGQALTIPALTANLAALVGTAATSAPSATTIPTSTTAPTTPTAPTAPTTVTPVEPTTPTTPVVEQPVDDGLSAYKLYTVKRGDTLTSIARAQLGDERKKDHLFELNKRLGLMQNINSLKIGQQIALGLK